MKLSNVLRPLMLGRSVVEGPGEAKPVKKLSTMTSLMAVAVITGNIGCIGPKGGLDVSSLMINQTPPPKRIPIDQAPAPCRPIPSEPAPSRPLGGVGSNQAVALEKKPSGVDEAFEAFDTVGALASRLGSTLFTAPSLEPR